MESSVSLCELTNMCQELSGRSVEIGCQIETRPNDVRVYISDNSKVMSMLEWRPKFDLSQIILEVIDWVKDQRKELKGILGF